MNGYFTVTNRTTECAARGRWLIFRQSQIFLYGWLLCYLPEQIVSDWLFTFTTNVYPLVSDREGTSAVPHNSNFDPILILICLNNVVKSLHCKTLLFADDIPSMENSSVFENDFANIDVWCLRSTNLILINVGLWRILKYLMCKTDIVYCTGD